MDKGNLITLVKAVQQGDVEAAGKLYSSFYNDVYYFIKKTVKDSALAEDLTQDTFLEILQSTNKLQEPAAFVTWSRQIAYHKCTAYFKKRKDLLADENEDGSTAFDNVAEDREEFIPDEALEQGELKKTIQAMIDELPEEQRTAILMRYFDELSVKDIALVQGVSEGTVKSRLNYGRKAIKTSVESWEKKSNVKLRCAGVLPLLLWYFYQLRRANTTAGLQAMLPAGTSVAGMAAAAGAASSSTGVVATASAAGKALATKIVAGVLAAVVAVGGLVAAVTSNAPNSEEQQMLQRYGEIVGYLNSLDYVNCFPWEKQNAFATIYQELEGMEAIDKWLGDSSVAARYTGLDYDEVPSRQDVLEQFVVIEDVLLGREISYEDENASMDVRNCHPWHYDVLGNEVFCPPIDYFTFYNGVFNDGLEQNLHYISYYYSGPNTSRTIPALWSKMPPYADGMRNYDEQGRLQSITFEGNASIIYHYDNEQRIEKIISCTDVYTTTFLYTYNDAGQLTQEKMIIPLEGDTDSDSTYTMEYTYDDQGRLLTGIFTDEYRMITYAYNHDAKDRLYTETVTLYSDGQAVNSYRIDYVYGDYYAYPCYLAGGELANKQESPSVEGEITPTETETTSTEPEVTEPSTTQPTETEAPTEPEATLPVTTIDDLVGTWIELGDNRTELVIEAPYETEVNGTGQLFGGGSYNYSANGQCKYFTDYCQYALEGNTISIFNQYSLYYFTAAKYSVSGNYLILEPEGDLPAVRFIRKEAMPSAAPEIVPNVFLLDFFEQYDKWECFDEEGNVIATLSASGHYMAGHIQLHDVFKGDIYFEDNGDNYSILFVDNGMKGTMELGEGFVLITVNDDVTDTGYSIPDKIGRSVFYFLPYCYRSEY